MKHKFTNSMLLICVILLGAFIWFFERDSETSQQQTQRIRTLFSVYPGTIDWIQMERGDVQIECSRIAGEWRMIRPADAPVNGAVVEQMIAGMANVERGELISEETLVERGLTPTDYGFDKPRARIQFKNSHGSFTWLIGRDAPLGNMLYVISAGSGDIAAASKNLLNLVPEDPAWIRDRTLFKSKAAAVRGIDLRRTTGFIQLRQTADNEWMIQQPQTGRADRQQVNALIEKAVAAHIDEFILDEPADLTVYGLEEPAVELTLFTQNESSQTLRIGKAPLEKPKARYAKWTDSPSIFTVPGEWVDAFDLDATLLRNRQIMGEQPNRISALTITRGEQQIEMMRTNNQWQISRPSRWNADPAAVRTLLESLSESVIESFVDAPDETQTELIKNSSWEVAFTAGENTHTLRFSRSTPDDRQLLVQRDEDPSLYLIGGELFDDSFTNPLFYRSRTVLEISPTEIKTITLETREKEFKVETRDGQFTAVDHAQKINAEAIMELTSQLIALRTDRYVSFNPDSLTPYGLENPTARLVVALNKTNILGQVVLIGDPAEDGRYAMLQGQSIVFVLPEKTAEALTRELTQSIEKKAEEIKQP